MAMHLLAIQLPTDPGTWALALGIIATAYVFMRAKRKSDRQFLSDARSSPGPSQHREAYYESLTHQRRVETQMSGLLVELEQMARQMNAQLDTRAARMEELIRQADERLAELRSELARQGVAPPPATAVPPARPDDIREEAEAEDSGEPPPPPPIPIDPRHAAVYRLADQGRTSSEIAREVGQPAGEVELILALRRRAR